MAATPAPAPHLVRALRRWDLVAVLLNGVIGAGIFGLPSKIFSLAGPYSLAAFTVCAICVAFIALSFAEVASRYSGTGGPYLYAADSYGSLPGFTIGWLVWIARITSFAANCNLLPAYLDLFFPGAASGLPRAVIITVVTLVLTIVNISGIRAAANTSNAFVIGKLLPLTVFIVAGLFFLDPSRFSFHKPPGYGAFSQSVLLLVYAFTGFEMALIPAGEVREARRNVPAALLIGMAVVVTFYILIQVVCIGTLPQLAGSQRPLADAAAQFSGNAGAAIIIAGMTISVLGNLNIVLLSASRLVYAMADRGDLPATLSRIHLRYRTPVPSIIASAVIMLVLTLSGTFIYLVTLSTISRLVTYMATCGAVPVLRRKASADPAAFLLPAGPAIAAVGILIGAWLLSTVTLSEARDTALAVLGGLVIYFLNRRRILSN